jgi:DNA-binding CsgD family transcriptional regulator
LINRSALHSWLLFLVLSLVGVCALLYDAPFTIITGSFAKGLGDGLGYIIIYYICGGVIKQSKSHKMYKRFCLMVFAEYFVISGILDKCYSLFKGQTHILAFAIVFVLSCICFLLTPLLQRRLFDVPWTDGFYLADMPEYAPAIAQAEKVDHEEQLVLSQREKEILGLLLTELSTKEIARDTGLTYSGANFHIQKLYTKLGVQSRTELLAKYIKK